MKHYFAYGTLFDVPSMKAFAPSAEPGGDAARRLRAGLRRDASEGKGGCWLKQADGGAVWGLQYRLSDEDMERLDTASGVPIGLWVHLPVTLTDAKEHKVESVTYTIPNDPPAFRPGPDYVAKILAGLSALPVPEDYAAQVRAKIAAATA